MMIKEDILKQIEEIEKEKENLKQQYKDELKLKVKEQRKLKKVIRLLDKE